MYKVEHPEWSNAQGWDVYDDNKRDEGVSARVYTGTQEQAEYAAMILNAGGLGDLDGLDFFDIEQMIEEECVYTNCTSCEQTFMQGELDASKRCDECAS